MRIRPLIIGSLALPALIGCAHEISSEERLERATQDIKEVKPVPPSDQLMQINCRDTDGELAKARNVDRPETERVQAYTHLYKSLRQKAATIEDAIARNPDLTYQEGSQKLAQARDTCVRQTADVKVEFERYVRELVEVPTVQEVKSGNTLTIARLDFEVLRTAIDTLSPEDRDALLDRVANAEKKLGQKEPRRKK